MFVVKCMMPLCDVLITAPMLCVCSIRDSEEEKQVDFLAGLLGLTKVGPQKLQIFLCCAQRLWSASQQSHNTCSASHSLHAGWVGVQSKHRGARLHHAHRGSEASRVLAGAWKGLRTGRGPCREPATVSVCLVPRTVIRDSS